MKKLIARLLLVCMLLSVLAVLPAMPVYADELRLKTDKTTYTVGEPIMVTATGSGADWVGLYLADEPYDSNNGGMVSIHWYYVARDGNVSGDTKDITQADYNNLSVRTEFAGVLPAGEYKVVLMENDGYNELERVYITVVDGDTPDTPSAPKSASYKSADAGVGRADGTLTILQGGTAPESYVIRWANADGPLAGYTEVATISCTGTSVEYTMTPNTLIPAGADRLLVYAKSGDKLSEKPATAKLPDGAGIYDLGKVLGELQVMSDIHINPSDTHIHNKHFAAALADICKNSPNSMGIFVNGDVADHGQANEYTAFNRLIGAAGEGVPPVLCAIGNHDLGGGQSAEAQIAQFLRGTNNDSETVYFEREVGGYRFIFLGGETTALNASLSRAQLDWLDETLDKSEDGKPVFLFLHQGVMDMVAGTFAYQGWHGVDQAAHLKKILKDHPEVIMFAGHSHWTLESKQSIKPADDSFPTVLNTSSCAYLWDDEANKTNQGIEGSQGYYITVYENYIAFRGRDFANGLWTSSAQFVIPWTLTATDDPSDETTSNETAEKETEAPTPGTDETTEKETDALTPDETETGSVETTPETGISDTTPETDAPVAASGCSSAVGAIAFLAVLAAGVLCRRRED